MTKYKSIIYCIPFIIICALFPGVSSADTIIEDPFFLQNAAINNGGVYTLTQADSPYYFEYSSYIDKDITINIEPGVEIHLNNSGNFYVNNGTINFKGTKDSPIMFGANGAASSLGFWAESNGDHLVKLNINNTHFHNMRSVYMSRNVVANINDVVLSNMKITPLGFSQNVKVKINGIQYKDISMHTPTHLINVYPSDDVFSLDPMILEITNSDFVYNEYLPFLIYISDHRNQLDYKDAVQIKISHSVFDGYSQISPFYYRDAASIPIDARNNYWGTPDGPYHTGSAEITNGPQLPVFVEYVPFLTSEIGSETKEESENDTIYKECCSSVIFLPGIQGSRLYKQRLLGGEDQLWEPNTPSDIEDLYGDAMGNTDPSIYTRDVIERTNIFLGGSIKKENFYKNISDNLRDLKSTNTINDWLAVPYDWRENVNDIVDNGIKLEDKTMFLIPELERLSQDSQTGKVTILTHSNGGLLAKMLIKELESQNKSNLVDKVIMVSAPQTGTPDAIYALLHGLSFDWKFRKLAPQSYNRELAQNIEMTYSLLPSQKYYESPSYPVVFDESLGSYGGLLNSYGNSIDGYDEMKSFILGQLDSRMDAEFRDTNQIGLGNAYLYDKAEIVHSEIDNYEFPDNIKLYQISGTGSMTNKAILYKNRKTLTKQVFTPYLVKSIYGDGTVLNKSSAVMDGSKFYFDLYNYNKDKNLDLNHANILESTDLSLFISGLIKDIGITTSPYIDISMPDYRSIKTTKIKMHSPVDIHLYDSQGRHTGPVYENINGEIIQYIEESIPNSQYELIGETASIIVSGDETYELKLDGYDTGVFTLSVDNYIGDDIVSSQSFVDLPAASSLVSNIIINPTQLISEINLDINGDKEIDIVAKNDGTVLDLNKPEAPIVKDEIPKDIPILPVSGGVVSLQFLEKVNSAVDSTKNIANEIPNKKIVQTIPKIVKNNITLPKKTVAGISNKNIPISSRPNTGNKSQTIKSQQTASAGNAEMSKRFNIIELIKKIFKKK